MKKTRFWIWFEGVRMFFKSKERKTKFMNKMESRNRQAEELREKWYAGCFWILKNVKE